MTALCSLAIALYSHSAPFYQRVNNITVPVNCQGNHVRKSIPSRGGKGGGGGGQGRRGVATLSHIMLEKAEFSYGKQVGIEVASIPGIVSLVSSATVARSIQCLTPISDNNKKNLVLPISKSNPGLPCDN